MEELQFGGEADQEKREEVQKEAAQKVQEGKATVS